MADILIYKPAGSNQIKVDDTGSGASENIYTTAAHTYFGFNGDVAWVKDLADNEYILLSNVDRINNLEGSLTQTVAGVEAYFLQIIGSDSSVSGDVTVPTITSITIEDTEPTKLVMVFSEAVTGTNLGFTIAGTTSTAFASIAGSGTATLTGTMAAAATSDDTVTFSYSETTGDIADISTSTFAMEDITSMAVVNNVAPPVLETATVEDAAPKNIVMEFDVAVTGTNLGFTIAGTTSTAFASIAGSGTTTITGTMAANVVEGETVTVSYAETTGDLVDGDSNPLEDITANAITNNVAAPVLDTAHVADAAPKDIVMNFDVAVTGTNLGFTIAGTTSTAFASIAGSGTVEITGTLAANVAEGETVTVSYSESTGDLVDAGTNALQDITAAAVTSTVSAPVLSTAVIENGAQTDIVMEFDSTMTGTNLGFTIAGTTSVAFASIAGSGTTTITGTLATTAISGETITVSYDKSTGDLVDSNTSALEDISLLAVTNNSTAPVLNTATVEDAAPTDVVMVFDQNITGTNLGFTIAGTTSAVFDSISGSGTATITGVLAVAVANGDVVLVDYVESTGDLVDGDSNPVVDITDQAVTNNVAV